MSMSEEGKKKAKGGDAAKQPPVRAALKKSLRELKKGRKAAKEARDAVQLARLRSRYKRVNRALRRGAPPKAKAAKTE
jgi:hypothetical protein